MGCANDSARQLGDYMKLMSVLAVATAIGGVSAAPAFAQAPAPAAPEAPPEPAKTDHSGFYFGGGINLYFLDRDFAAGNMPLTFEDQPSPGAFMGRLGYAFNENFAVELEAGIGGADAKFTTSGGGPDGDVGLENPVGAHIVLKLPMSGVGYLHAKAGVVSAKVTREYLGTDYGDSDLSGGAFGVGGGFRSGDLDFRMEYSFMSGDSGDGGVLGMFVYKHF